jgi:hypothetical protein
MIREISFAACAASGKSAAQALAEQLGADRDFDAFWGKVAANLVAGRIRMLFVADRIPPELRKVVEFLNVQMRPAEVLAIELRQYQGEGLRTLVPILLGPDPGIDRSEGRGRRRQATASGIDHAFSKRSRVPEIPKRAQPPRILLPGSRPRPIARSSTTRRATGLSPPSSGRGPRPASRCACGPTGACQCS